MSQWGHPTISSSVVPFSSCPQSFPASESFPVSQLFASDGHSIGASASASVLLMNTQGWFSLRLTGLISLQSKGLARVFSNTTVQKHQFFSVQPSLWSNSHVYAHFKFWYCHIVIPQDFTFPPLIRIWLRSVPPLSWVSLVTTFLALPVPPPH